MDSKVTLSIKKEYLRDWMLFEERHPINRSEAVMLLVRADNEKQNNQEGK